jgi:hypothetical protein
MVNKIVNVLKKIKEEVSSSRFWDNLDDETIERYDNFSSPELIAEFVVDHIIEKIKKGEESEGSN